MSNSKENRGRIGHKTIARSRALLTTTAVAAVLTALTAYPTAGHAQTYTQPQQFTSQGADGAEVTNVAPGNDGQKGGDYNPTLTSGTIISATDPTILGWDTQGGKGSNATSEDNQGLQGGRGGDGGAFLGQVQTATGQDGVILDGYGPSSTSLQVNSQGGDGGDGSAAANTGSGGTGGAGGAGGALAFSESGSGSANYVGTKAALNLQSQGGNGGSGGQSLIDSVFNSTTGATGGAGGKGGDISANLTGRYVGAAPANSAASGVVAVSQGGNGGQGGEGTNDAGKAYGGGGGAAGAGGAITINVIKRGGIQVTGAAQPGVAGPGQFDSSTDPSQKVALDTSFSGGAIVAESRGGEGGLGGVSSGVAADGGSGAIGGHGGDVNVTLASTGLGAGLGNPVISTTGYNTFGVLALSAGGDGGQGESAGGAFFRSGGHGGVGGDAGQANIRIGNDGSVAYPMITTTGDNSDALVALSIGGGGGYAGSVNSAAGLGFNVSIGGKGANGGNATYASVYNGYYDPPPTNGGTQAFHNPDVISTTGDYSRAIVAQSVGGGGGRGGDAESNGVAGTLSIGGQGGTGGDGGLANALNYGVVSTTGNQSSGIFAQSVGGGGGAGGGAISRSAGTLVTAAIAVGGSGGVGGNGVEADIYNLGQVQTTGSNAHALFAQSVGGGGGVGGTSLAETLAANPPDTPSLTLTTAVGGSGGAGGNGGDVNVLNAHLLETQGVDAYGVFAQSVGGGGGAGGDASAISTGRDQSQITSTTAVGGMGSGGGDGGAVHVWNSGLISTSNERATGIFAQSVGGGGGDGGFGSTDQGSYQAPKYSLNLTVTVGGNGGKGGNGGDVTVDNYVTGNSGDPTAFTDRAELPGRAIDGAGGIMTIGDVAPAIFAQSVGGGGGNGGGSAGKGENGQIAVNVSVGGIGGAGGNGGAVLVHNGDGAILTYGAQSYGVFGQSVGGGGGTGGKAATGPGDDPQYAYASQIAQLLAAGTIKDPSSITKVTDQLWDWKDNLSGEWDDLSKLYSLATVNAGQIDYGQKLKPGTLEKADLTVDIGAGWGGNAGAGGDGGSVSVDSSGLIATHGAMAYGLFGQSVGGGGGVGGASAPTTANDQLPVAAVQAAIAVGGQGGKGGNGGAVSVSNTGSIDTGGDAAFGILAQSIGGGGGVGGATIPNNGLGGTPINVVLGAQDPNNTGAVSGAGSVVTATNTGTISTHGSNAIGIVAQSVGGGGGVAVVTGQANPTGGIGNSDSLTLNGGTTSVALGRNYWAKGTNGGDVTVNASGSGSITTDGINSIGILAQSIGGGGGLFIVGPHDNTSVSQFVGAPTNFAPGDVGDAGTVTVNLSQPIVTKGDGAAGIVAQSIGGGGGLVNGLNGIVLTNSIVGTGANLKNSGVGGNISVDVNSSITTTGAYAHGVFAQAASGSGGAMGSVDASNNPSGSVFSGQMRESDCDGTYWTKGGNCGGDVVVGVGPKGSITVSGPQSWGIVAESHYVDQMYSNPDQEDMSRTGIIVYPGGIVKAQGNAAGAILVDGTGNNFGGIYANTIQNFGTIDGGNGYAVYSSGESYEVNNSSTGVIRGNFSAYCHGTCASTGQSASVIQNQGLIEAGNTIDLGGGQLINHGVVSIGASGTVARTNLTGDFVQGSDGVLKVDYDGKAGTNDVLAVTGKATLDGQVQLAPTALHKDGPITVLTAAGGVSTTQAPVAAAPSGPPTPYTTTQSVAGNSLQEQINADFKGAAADLGQTQQAVASHLQQVWDKGNRLDTGFTALYGVNDDHAAYGSALNSMSGQALGQLNAVRYRNGQVFAQNMLDGCPDGVDEMGRCVWAKVSQTYTRQGATADAGGYTVDATASQAGVSVPLTSNLTLSGSLGFSTSTLTGDYASTIQGTEWRAGGMLTYRTGRWELSGAVDGSYGHYTSDRHIQIGQTTLNATSTPELSDIGAHFRVAYDQQFGALSVKPYVDLHASQKFNSAFSESGAQDLNLAVESESDTVLSADAGLEISSQFKVGKDLTLKPFLRASVEGLNNGNWAAVSRFVGQTGTDGFKAVTPLPTLLSRTDVGAEIASGAKWNVRLEYGADFGSNYLAQSGGLRFAVKF